MPLTEVRELFSSHRAVFGTLFWIVVFASAYLVMIKVMHPAGKLFGF